MKMSHTDILNIMIPIEDNTQKSIRDILKETLISLYKDYYKEKKININDLSTIAYDEFTNILKSDFDIYNDNGYFTFNKTNNNIDIKMLIALVKAGVIDGMISGTNNDILIDADVEAASLLLTQAIIEAL